jgi:TM2 domain-containing membrane protein YozV
MHAVVPREGRSWVVTLLLALFIPLFGVHRFYTGNIVIGLLQLLTAGGCGIWWLIDVVLILTDAYRDADGYPLVK